MFLIRNTNKADCTTFSIIYTHCAPIPFTDGGIYSAAQRVVSRRTTDRYKRDHTV